MYPFQKTETSRGFYFHHDRFHVHFGNKTLTPETVVKDHPHIRFQYLKQTHSTQLVQFPKMTDQCDGYQWIEKNFAAIIRTADCLPLIAIDHVTHQISNLHCGRVGLVNGILQRFSELSDTSNKHSFFIGPHIMTYEIGEDLFQSLKKSHLSNLEVKNDRFYFSLSGFTKDFIQKTFKNSSVYDCNINTLTDSSYWSYRRDKGTIHRNLSYAYIEA